MRLIGHRDKIVTIGLSRLPRGIVRMRTMLLRVKKIDQGSVTMVSLSTAELELLPLEGATSSAWAYFGFSSSNGKIEKQKASYYHCLNHTNV